MNKVLIAAILAIGLTSCATSNELRKSPPELQINSAKTPKKIALCISDKWEDLGYPVNVRETEIGYALAVTINNILYFLADVIASGEEATTKFYVGVVSYDRATAAVKDCQI